MRPELGGGFWVAECGAFEYTDPVVREQQSKGFSSE